MFTEEEIELLDFALYTAEGKAIDEEDRTTTKQVQELRVKLAALKERLTSAS